MLHRETTLYNENGQFDGEYELWRANRTVFHQEYNELAAEEPMYEQAPDPVDWEDDLAGEQEHNARNSKRPYFDDAENYRSRVFGGPSHPVESLPFEDRHGTQGEPVKVADPATEAVRKFYRTRFSRFYDMDEEFYDQETARLGTSVQNQPVYRYDAELGMDVLQNGPIGTDGFHLGQGFMDALESFAPAPLPGHGEIINTYHAHQPGEARFSQMKQSIWSKSGHVLEPRTQRVGPGNEDLQLFTHPPEGEVKEGKPDRSRTAMAQEPHLRSYG